MKRSLAAALGALSLSLLLAGCVTVNVPPNAGPGPLNTPSLTTPGDDDDRRQVSCIEETVTLNEPGVDYLVTGDCDEVIVEGQDIDARIEQAASLVVRGDDNDVDVADLGTVLINGQGNDVELTATSSVAKIEIAGNDNDVSTNGSIKAVVFNGNENDIDFNGTLDAKSDNGTGNTVGTD